MTKAQLQQRLGPHLQGMGGVGCRKVDLLAGLLEELIEKGKQASSIAGVMTWIAGLVWEGLVGHESRVRAQDRGRCQLLRDQDEGSACHLWGRGVGREAGSG